MRNLIAADFKAALDQEHPFILDVRTVDEFEDGHIPGAVNVDIFDPAFAEQAQQAIGGHTNIFVYCRSGGRSASAAAQLSQAGRNITNLVGGITGWAVKGYPMA